MRTKLFFLKIVLTIMLTLPLARLAAQDSTSVSKPPSVEVHTRSNSVFSGKLLKMSRDSATFKDSSGRVITLAKSDIRSIDYVDIQGRQLRWGPNPNTGRYLLSSTAYTLPKGDFTFESTYVFINSVHYGVSNRVTIGGGGDLIGGSVSFLNSKVNIMQRDRHKFSVGINYYRMPSDFIQTYSGEDIRDLGMIYGASTWGNSNDHVTFGVGYVYIGKGFTPPMLSLSGTKRLTRHFGLVTENWFLFSGDQTGIPVIISLGARYISRRSSIDFAMYSTDENPFRSMVPFISYCFRIDRQH